MTTANTSVLVSGQDGVLTRPGSFNELDVLPVAQLEALYRDCPAPSSMRPLDGHPAGRGMALIGFRTRWLAAIMRLLARSRRFVWRGKSFVSINDKTGRGDNRLLIGKLIRALPFATRIAPSIIDDRDCIAIDYNYPGNSNPGIQRRMYDELREIAPGLYFGPVTQRWFGKRRIICWFAVQIT